MGKRSSHGPGSWPGFFFCADSGGCVGVGVNVTAGHLFCGARERGSVAETRREANPRTVGFFRRKRPRSAARGMRHAACGLPPAACVDAAMGGWKLATAKRERFRPARRARKSAGCLGEASCGGGVGENPPRASIRPLCDACVQRFAGWASFGFRVLRRALRRCGSGGRPRGRRRFLRRGLRLGRTRRRRRSPEPAR